LEQTQIIRTFTPTKKTEKRSVIQLEMNIRLRKRGDEKNLRSARCGGNVMTGVPVAR
jgi:hypothetical protein